MQLIRRYIARRMSALNSNNVSAKLLLLKDLDSTIDFSRATNQFSIVLYLAEQVKPVSVSELAKVTGDSRKSILDSLRKLEKKGLIIKLEEGGELYVGLSEQGREFVRKLLEMLMPAGQTRGEVLDVPLRLNISKELATSINLYRLIVLAGLSKKGYVTFEEASRVVIGGVRGLEVVVESFTRPPTRLFRVVRKGGSNVLVLDKQGLEVLKRTPHYRALQRSPLFRVAVALTGKPFVREAGRRLNVILGALGLASMVGSLLLENTVFLAIAIGALALIVGVNQALARLQALDLE
jgi:biotin operon repressor